jgi:hypothetical protein
MFTSFTVFSPIQWAPGLKRSEHQSDHSPPSSAEFKNGRIIPPLPYTSSWRVAKLIEERDFIFLSVLERPETELCVLLTVYEGNKL